MRLNKFLKVIIVLLLIGITFPVTTGAAPYKTKDEVIYGKLYDNGQVKDMYVVNSFYETTTDEIIDYGSYSEVRNLTDLSDLTQDEASVTFKTVEEDFYYQGELTEHELPWHINISYYLDGNQVDADSLAGQSGKLEIHIETKANKKVDPIFFDYYLLQISLTLDPLHFQQITAPKGTEAKEGKNKLINFSAMPGEEDIFITTAIVENFTMEPISISAIPANLAFDDPDLGDMEDDMKKLSDAIKQLHDGVVKLYDGVLELDDGTGKLKEGSGEFLKGMQTLDSSSKDLVSGSRAIKNAFSEINDTLDVDFEFDLPDADDLKELAKIIREMSQELLNFSGTFKEIDELLNEISSNGLGGDDFAKVYTALDDYGADREVYDIVNELITTYTAISLLADVSENSPIDLENAAEEMAQYLAEVADELENNLHLLDDFSEINELVDGLQTMAREYNQFHKGLVEYTNGVNELTKVYAELDQGIDELSAGTGSLKSGIKELVDGTEELHEATSDLPNDIESELEAFMEDFDFSDFKPKSFVSKKNKKIGVVQFVLQTESIELPENDTEEEVEEKSKSLWQRFLDLFR